MLYALWDLGLKVGHSQPLARRDGAAGEGRPDDPHRAARGALRLGRPGALRRGGARASRRRCRPAPRAASSPRSSPSATRATSGWATAATSSSPTSRRARAACATSTRSSGSANTSTTSSASPSWSSRACSPPTNIASSTAPRISCGRCAATSTSIAGRAEDRLTFDVQREIAERMRFADRPGKSAVERFMQYYFLQAKTVGDLTGRVPRASRREVRGARAAVRACRRCGGGRASCNGFVLDRGRLALPRDDFFARRSGAADRDVRARRPARAGDPSAGDARRRARRQAGRRHPRAIPRANALFLDVLTSRRAIPNGAALDERGRRVRPLRARFRPRRRADAVRHVPPLHGRRAHDPRDRPARRIEQGELQGRPSARHRDHASRSCRAACSMSRCCCTTSPRGAAATIRCSAPRWRERLCPRFGLTAGRDRDGRLAGALASADVGDRVQARPVRFQDDPRFRRGGAEPRAAAPAAAADRRRHPRGRAGRLERLEAPVARRPVRGRRGGAAARPQAARAQRADRRQAGGAAARARLGRERVRRATSSACPKPIGSPSPTTCSSAMPG